jgi:hypothetical protein
MKRRPRAASFSGGVEEAPRGYPGPSTPPLEETMCGRDYAPPLELAKQADEPPPLGRLVGYWQRRDQQLVDFGRQ